jgi:hypothetical protein
MTTIAWLGGGQRTKKLLTKSLEQMTVGPASTLLSAQEDAACESRRSRTYSRSIVASETI